ncbi:hypothetical protein Tco_0370849 [Tanacetum coccineum]
MVPTTLSIAWKILNKPLLNMHLSVPRYREDWYPISWHLKTTDWSKFEADYKQQQSEMTNKIDTVFKAITNRLAGPLPSNTVKNSKLSTSPVLSAQQEREGDPEDSNTITYIEERRDTPLLGQKDIIVVGNLGSNKDDEGIEWFDVEEPLDLVDTSEESVYESLIKEMPKCLLNYDFRIKKSDPRNLKIPCMIGHKFTANAYIDVDLPMNVMSLAYYNSIRKNGYGYRGRNFVGLGRDMHVFSTWMAFGGNTRDLGSFREETNEITDLHQILEEVLVTERGDGVAGIKRRRRDASGDGILYRVDGGDFYEIFDDLRSCAGSVAFACVIKELVAKDLLEGYAYPVFVIYWIRWVRYPVVFVWTIGSGHGTPTSGDAKVFSTWMAFGGNTRDLGSFGIETDDPDLYQIHEEILFSKRGDSVTGIKRRCREPSSDGVRDLMTASGRSRLNEDLESST